jgi:hypothetical protein
MPKELKKGHGVYEQKGQKKPGIIKRAVNAILRRKNA